MPSSVAICLQVEIESTTCSMISSLNNRSTRKNSATLFARPRSSELSASEIFRCSPDPVGLGLISYAGESFQPDSNATENLDFASDRPCLKHKWKIRFFAKAPANHSLHLLHFSSRIPRFPGNSPHLHAQFHPHNRALSLRMQSGFSFVLRSPLSRSNRFVMNV